MKARRCTGYEKDLAYIHDRGFTDQAQQAARFLTMELRKRKIRRGLIIDLGCGTGVLANDVLQAGYEVLGIDISRSMITIARKQAPNGRFRVASLFAAGLEPCVAVTAVGECFNYLFDKRNSKRALIRLFKRIHAVLCPGGLLVFDFAEPGRAGRTGVRQAAATGDNWAVLAVSRENAAKRILERNITTFRKVGRSYHRGYERHVIRLLDRGDVMEQLRQVGFRVRVVFSYGSRRFPEGVVGIMAMKVGTNAPK